MVLSRIVSMRFEKNASKVSSYGNNTVFKISGNIGCGDLKNGIEFSVKTDTCDLRQNSAIGLTMHA